MRRIFLLVLLSFLLSIHAQTPAEVEMEKKIHDLLSQMTLAEKIGQLTLYTADFGDDGPMIREPYAKKIEEGKVGSIFNAFGVGFTRKLQTMAVEKSHLKIPLLFGFDVIHGFKTIFPIPLGEAASWDLEMMEKTARIAAREAAASGLHWTFAPMVDIARDPRWGRIAEGAGEDTYLGSCIAKARVLGFQGEKIGADDSVLACAKHFAAYGAAQAGRDYNIVDISERTLWEVYLPPFKAAVDAGVCTFMTAFNEINGIPCTGNPYLMTDVLRNQWKFQGFVVSDYTALNELVPHGVAANFEDAARLALTAGVDMDMEGAVFENNLALLLQQGKITMQQIDTAVYRILRLKYRLGLFEDPYRYCNPEREHESVFTTENQAVALDMAKKSIVLLKNEGNLLPIAKNAKTIAVLGPLADNQKELIGSWSGAGDWKQSVTLLTGIQKKVSKDTKVTYALGCEIQGSEKKGFDEALSLAKAADVVIVALGEEAGMSGEAASRSSIDLPGVQEKFLKKLAQLQKPIVLVLMNGRPLTIPWAAENIPAILECWFLGSQTGNAIAEVLFGDYNPSGKLPVTFPRSVGQVPLYYSYKKTGRPVSPEKYTSRYIDIANTPLYPFGHGLSYTTFSYSALTLSKKNITAKENLSLSVQVKNIGKVLGTETVQLYLQDEVASVTRPVQELKRFQKIILSPEESRVLTFELTPEDFAFYDASMHRIVEPGFFTVMVGGSSQYAVSERFSIVESVDKDR